MNQTMGVIGTTGHAESLAPRSVGSVDGRGGGSSSLSLRARLMEVEAEHLRLQRLVAELLIKNQKLRELLCEQAGTSAAAASVCRGDGAIGQGHASSH
jgi:hypothetical protein